ncbi:MAG: hypothetical protein ABIR19_11075 [Ginsengibacter sp.]
MLEELFNLVKNAASDSVINNPEVPNDKNNAIVAEATNTVASGLRNIVAGGGAQNLASLFGNKGSSGGGLLSNPIVSMMIGHFAGKLMSKFNLGSGQANNISSSLIPNVLGGLINRHNDSSDSGFSLDKLLNSITGGKSDEILQKHQSGGSGGGLSDILSKVTGGDSGSGGGGLMDIVSQLAGGAQQQQQKNGGGGLMDIISGFLK